MSTLATQHIKPVDWVASDHRMRRAAAKKSPIDQVRSLAARGLTKKEIANELGITLRTFLTQLASSLSMNQAWEAGAKESGTFRESQRSRTLEADEGTVVIQPIDEIVFEALEKKRLGRQRLPVIKRMSHLRQLLPGLTVGEIVTSIERLEANLRVGVREGVIYTEYEAYEHV